MVALEYDQSTTAPNVHPNGTIQVCWRGGIEVTLFIDSLPSDGPVYTWFGMEKASTVRLNWIEVSH